MMKDMYELSDTLAKAGSLEGPFAASTANKKSTYPFTIGNRPPHNGFWQDPETGVCYSGRMEIAPLERRR